MISRSICAVICALLLFTPIATHNQPAETLDDYAEGEVAIKFSRTCTAEDIAEIAANLGAKVKYRFKLFEAEHWEITTTSVADALRRYGSDPRIEYIEPNYRLYLDSTYPNDPRFGELWGMYNRGEVRGQADADIDATDAWDIETGAGVIVGVCDSGVDYEHEDLAANIYVNLNEVPGNGIDDDHNGFVDDVRGWDFGDEDNDPMDESGHGSHVAGTIAAVGNNGVGVVGVSWNARILPLKIVDSEGGGFTFEAAKAIEYAVMMGAKVTNHSWGGSSPATTLNNAILAAEAAGVLTVASAGNSGVELNDYNQHFPAGLPYDGIVSVANTTSDDRLASSSNWSAVNVDLAAPGSGIVSTTPGNQYESYTGTSMSAPHVTGAISVIWSHAPHLTLGEVKDLLIATVDSLPDLVGTTVSGGRLNLHRALMTLDTAAPDGVTDLLVTLAGRTTVTLAWTASGDDGAQGKAKRYDIRYSTQPIDADNFDVVTPVLDPPVPLPAGATEVYVISGLRYGTAYYFALRVFDSHGNGSPISNVVSVATVIASPPPQIVVTPSTLVKTLPTGATATKQFSITNTGTGDLEWEIGVTDGGYVPGVVVTDGELPLIARASAGDEPDAEPPVGVTEGFLHGVRIVFDASHGQTQDRWDTIVADLHARGATVSVNPDPLTPSLLDTTDVLWFTDVPPPASIMSTEVSIVARWVRGGGGLLLEGDDDVTLELYNRILHGLSAGIEFSPDDGTPGVSSNVFPHETTDGVTTVLFEQNGAFLSRVSAPAEPLIEDSNGVPAAAVVKIGSGRVVAMADELSDDSRAGEEDNRHFANRVFGWLAGSFWASPRPVAGVVQPGESADVGVRFDARGLPGGIYTAQLQVESNDPAAPTSPVDVTLGVTAAPDIAVSHSAIDFGIVFTTVTDSVSIAVHNGGKDTLRVYDVDATGSDFSVDVTIFSLAPEEGREVVVAISPSGPGTVTETLSITSNDPDEALIEIPLTVEASDPPIISVVPDSLHETRFGDEVVTRKITIANDGEYNLEFTVVVVDDETSAASSRSAEDRPPFEPLPDDRSGEILVVSGAEKEALIFVPPAATVDHNKSGLIIFGDDFEDGDFDGWDNIGLGSKEVTDRTAADGTVFSYHEFNSEPGHFNGIYKMFGATQPAYVSFHIRPGAVNEADAYVNLRDSNNRHVTYIYCSSGGQLCVNAGNPGQDCSIEYDAERWYFVELKNFDYISRTFDYFVDYVLIAEDVPFMGPRNDVAGIHLYNYSGGSQAWWDEIVVASANVVSWLTTNPSGGVVPPHATVDVEVTFDATKLFTGRHERAIAIRSNDPATPEVRIAAVIEVTAVPNIVVGDSLLDFGKTVVGIPRTLPFKVVNRSLQETLVVSDIVSDLTEIVVDPEAVTLGPGQQAIIEITFSPVSQGPVSGNLTISSNDRDEPAIVIPMVGIGADPPVLSVSPDSIHVDLLYGHSTTRSLLFSNPTHPQGADLEFSIVTRHDDEDNRSWIRLLPKKGVVPPGDTLTVTVTFDAAATFGGDYGADLSVYNNIPGAGETFVCRTTMHVTGDPRLAVADSLDFGRVYLGFPKTEALSVSNLGSDALVVDSAWTDDPVFSVSPDSFSVPAGDNREIEVTLAPGATGMLSALLNIASNDTSAALTQTRLLAEVVAAPVVDVGIDSLHVILKEGRALRETVTLSNRGESDLIWTVDLSFAPDTTAAAGERAARENSSGGVAADPSLMDVLWYGSHGFGTVLWSTAIGDIVANGGHVTESEDDVTTALLEPYDILWLGNTDEALAQDEMDVIVKWVRDGGSMLIEADNQTAAATYSALLEQLSSGIRLSFLSLSGGIAVDIRSHETTTSVKSTMFPAPTALLSSVSEPAGVLIVNYAGAVVAGHSTVAKGRVVVVTDQVFSDIVLPMLDNRLFARQVFEWLSGTRWLTIEPLAGTLAPNTSVDMDLSFDAGALPVATYELAMEIEINDPANPRVDIPLKMTVEPLVLRTVDLAMDGGLNLRSWNVELDADSTAAILAPILSDVVSVQGFDGGGLVFDPTVPPQFNTLNTMDHLHGYWFRLSQATTLSLEGAESDHQMPIPVSAGYNLVGYLPSDADSTAHALQSVLDNTIVALGYEGGGLTFDPSVPPDFNTLRVLKPGFGYWVKLEKDDMLIYPQNPLPTPAEAAANAPGDNGPVDSGTPAVTPTSEWIGVWGDNIRVNGDLVPRGTVVQAVDLDGVVCGRAVAWDGGRFGLMAVYRDDPATGVDEGANPDESVTILVGDEYAFEGVKWTGMGDVVRFDEVARMTPREQALPRRTALHQNFPNPFNPTTVIPYDLAGSGKVTLTVYSIRGERVRTLVNAEQDPGRYRIPWNGLDNSGQRVASGIYFFKLTAGSFVQTRKLVLLK